MPDRSDPPEYDWLYGKHKRQDVTPPTDTEPTRVMPRTPSPHPMARDRPSPGPVAPTAAPTKKRQVPYGKLVLLLLVAWIAYLVAVPIFAWTRIDTVNATPAGSR